MLVIALLLGIIFIARIYATKAEAPSFISPDALASTNKLKEDYDFPILTYEEYSKLVNIKFSKKTNLGRIQNNKDIILNIISEGKKTKPELEKLYNKFK